MSQNICAPGPVCAPAYVWIIFAIFIFVQLQKMWKLREKVQLYKQQIQIAQAAQQTAQQAASQQQNQVVHEHIQFPRVETDPLIPPGRIGEYAFGTKGGVNSFEKWGFLINDTDQNTRIPLYGRKLHTGGDQYEYYVITHGNNKVMLPNRKEIFTDDEVSDIPTFSDAESWRAYIYKPFSFTAPYW